MARRPRSSVPAIAFRSQQVRTLTNQIGVYILADLDNVPIYVGQSTDGIRNRVNRHLTSARSDIIGNRQLDVWEVAFVWAYPVAEREDIGPLEARLFNEFDAKSQLVNGTLMVKADYDTVLPEPSQVVQMLSDDDLRERRDPTQRLPRQANHYARIVDHFLTVKNSTQIARAMDTHFKRLRKYHGDLLGKADIEGGEGE